MALKSIRILVQIDWPGGVVSRMWDGGGPFADADGLIWRGATLTSDLDEIEQAINGEAYSINLSLIDVAAPNADATYQGLTNNEIIGGVVQIMIQPCDEKDQPLGDREVMFTGRIDNIILDDAVTADRPHSTITVEVTNRFQMRRLVNGSVLSDADQRSRSALLNPDAAPDQFCERVPGLADKTITWPRWN